MDFEDTAIILNAYYRKKIDQLEYARIIAYYSILPNLRESIPITEFLPLPSDEEQVNRNDGEIDLKEMNELNDLYNEC